MPLVAWGVDTSSLETAPDVETLHDRAVEALDKLKNDEYYKSIPEDQRTSIVDEAKGKLKFEPSDAGANQDSEQSDQNSDETESDADDLQKKVDDAQAKLDAAKETEQSLANRMLGGLSTLATGIGGMQLAQGIAEKSADSAADKDMDAYMATIKCTYGDGKTVPFSVDPVELPGGNNSDLMKYRAEYVALAANLKERKTALGMTPGIEAEEIIDKATAGLYDDENTGITGGTYASRYRAAVGNEKDQKGLNADKKEAKTRMIAGGVVAGVGVVGGIVGNSIINGKLGELIKKNKDKKASDSDNEKAISKLKSKAREAGLTDPEYIDKMDLESYNVGNYIDIIDKAKLKDEVKGKRIQDLCSTPAISCADNLLTEESKKEIMGNVAMGSTGNVGGKLLGGADASNLGKKVKDAVKNKTSDGKGKDEKSEEAAEESETYPFDINKTPETDAELAKWEEQLNKSKPGSTIWNRALNNGVMKKIRDKQQSKK